jgi:prepilin-type N-terminal cleavage/methylation domain-containing protein
MLTSVIKMNRKGFTIIELMVAMMILFISMTAILDFLVKYHRINLENTMRNESMRIAEAQLEQLRNAQFSGLSVGTTTTTTQIPIRRILVNYTVTRTIQAVSAGGMAPTSLAIRINVQWTYQGITHQHGASTIISTDV